MTGGAPRAPLSPPRSLSRFAFALAVRTLAVHLIGELQGRLHAVNRARLRLLRETQRNTTKSNVGTLIVAVGSGMAVKSAFNDISKEASIGWS